MNSARRLRPVFAPCSPRVRSAALREVFLNAAGQYGLARRLPADRLPANVGENAGLEALIRAKFALRQVARPIH